VLARHRTGGQLHLKLRRRRNRRNRRRRAGRWRNRASAAAFVGAALIQSASRRCVESRVDTLCVRRLPSRVRLALLRPPGGLCRLWRRVSLDLLRRQPLGARGPRWRRRSGSGCAVRTAGRCSACLCAGAALRHGGRISRRRRRRRHVGARCRHAKQVHMLYGGKTPRKSPELGTRGMRGSKPAGFNGVGDRAARSLDRVSRRRGPRRAAGASLGIEQRDLLHSSTMCATPENTAAVTMPARWWER
jgi:hypothetical protein